MVVNVAFLIRKTTLFIDLSRQHLLVLQRNPVGICSTE